MAATPATGWSPHCLAAAVSDPSQPIRWSGDAKKALSGAQLITAAGVQPPFARGFGLTLSRPTGRSVVQVGGERILKYEAGSMDPKDITFVDQPAEVVYHPAGRTIVASGMENGKPVLKIATNQGRDPKTLAVGETAKSLTSLAFTAKNALLFVADHGDEQHLHRLELESGKLTSVATVKAPGHIADVTTSPYPGGSVAWTQGGECDLVVEQDGTFIDVKGTAAAVARPVGWLPDRTLVVQTCGATGDLYVVSAGGAPKLLVQGVKSAGVRAVLPEPEAPPPAIPDQAPA